ncbi:lysophospholipid acyltransferase family protein [Altererythrobacter aquiaggeris]|uniref:lysophospholipid acyltransferase family protein n=1 Tax=Aestuarierythrobacter aquiaggeris TaxID=1898396 RepID=UPI00301A9451
MASGSTEKTDPADARARLKAATAAGAPTSIGLRGWLRLIARLQLIILMLIVMVPFHYVWRMFKYGSPLPMYFLRWAARIVGARVELRGKPLRRDVFFTSNHVSWVDILALAGASGTAFVAKQELRDTPVVGWLANLNRTVYVKREHRMGVAGQIMALRRALADNWSVTVFPEGTTTDGQSLLPFKTAMLKVLDPAPPEVRVQPVVVDYGAVAEWIGWIGNESGINNFKRVLAREGTFLLTLHYLEPFDPGAHGGRKEIGAEAYRQISDKLEEILGTFLREFAFEVAPVRYAPRDNADSALETGAVRL